MSLLHPFRAPLVGLDIGSDAVKAVRLKRWRGGWQLLGAAEAPLSEAGSTDPEAVTDAIRQALDTLRLRRARIAAALPGSAVIVKRLSLPAMTPQELADAITWEAEQYIPFDLADVQLDYEVQPAQPGAAETDLLLVAAKKEKIAERVDAVLAAGRQPVVLDVEAFALVNAYQASHPDREDPLVVLVHVGRAGAIICLLERGHLAFTRDVALGGDHYANALARELGVDPMTAERLKYPGRPLVPGVDPQQVTAVLRDVSGQLVTEIAKSVDFYRATAPIEKVSRVVLSGGASGAEGLVDAAAAEFDAPVEILDPFRSVHAVNARVGGPAGPTFAVAVGLAMRQDGAA